jgi:hypothetical protein
MTLGGTSRISCGRMSLLATLKFSLECYFSKRAAPSTKGKRGVNKIKSPKRGQKIWCHHIYVHILAIV